MILCCAHGVSRRGVGKHQEMMSVLLETREIGPQVEEVLDRVSIN